ncbi:GH1 family beta-glucosidase [Pseudoroseicyclus tamaricis]|uniref:GH1 family beta-glucosidase n=1 Tax=Pseudoroseicyclus tamaricis TaxID=2705421 RepID=UPI0019401797|nr:GH1 family beta-glucosidase [Pseudoroseicyclus tamaricis]
MSFSRSDFPEGFLFGAATAAYQIEGAQYGGAGHSHWDTFAATPGNVIRREDGAQACDHYHRYEEDFDILKAGGFDAYRFSTSWARVQPEGKGPANPEGLDFYDRLVDAMLARDLKPFLTLYHWELPSALADIGGWANREIPERFADFSELVMGRIGDRVSATATLNEPWCVAFLSHFLGHHAPGLRDIRATARAMHHVMLAHGLATERMRGLGHENLGIVLNFDRAIPASGSAEDRAATATQDAVFNRWFIEAITKGAYPEEALAFLGPHMPAGWEADMATINKPLDWLGVNYYTRHVVKANADDPMSPINLDAELPTTQMGWEIYPEGLEYFLTWLKDEQVGDTPLYVTENGMAWDDRVENGTVFDPERIGFIDGHYQAALRAIKAGANVKGFFYWSLLDNYEWAFGYEKRFGMVHVDFDSMVRTPKASYHALKAAMAR